MRLKRIFSSSHLKTYTAILTLLNGCVSGQGTLIQESAQAYKLSGQMSDASYRALIVVLEKNKDEPIEIIANSNGGWITGIDEAMDAIRKHGRVFWRVPQGGICQSACALLGIAANKIDGTLAFHSISATYNNNRYMMAGKDEELIEKIISYGYKQDTAERLLKSVNIFVKLNFKDGVMLSSQ